MPNRVKTGRVTKQVAHPRNERNRPSPLALPTGPYLENSFPSPSTVRYPDHTVGFEEMNVNGDMNGVALPMNGNDAQCSLNNGLDHSFASSNDFSYNDFAEQPESEDFSPPSYYSAPSQAMDVSQIALPQGYVHPSPSAQSFPSTQSFRESLNSSFSQLSQATEKGPHATSDVAYKHHESLKIDSALCKRLAKEPAQREPEQRRLDQKINIERRSNVEALLAQICGKEAPKPCKNCHKGHGPWTTCVVLDGQLCGSCTNCWFNASGSRCTFHENNSQQQQMPPAAVQQPSTAASHLIQYQPAGVSVPSLPQPSPSATVPRTPFSNTPPLQWLLPDSSSSDLISKALGRCTAFNKRERLLARINAAAKELGIRIAEFEEYMRTPEGKAEQQRTQVVVDEPQQQQQQQQPEASEIAAENSSG